MNQKMIDFVLKKAGLLALFFMVLACSVSAAAPDSLRTRWINGKKFVLHKVAAKETWSSVSRKYEVNIDDLQKANPGVDGLKIGQIINVPASPASPATEMKEKRGVSPASVSTTATPQKTSSPATTSYKTHTVAKGETLYRIATMYGMKVEELKALNGLSSNTISLGQNLKVKGTGSMPSGNQNESKQVVNEPKPLVSETKPAQEPRPAQEIKEKKAEKSGEVVREQPKEIKPELKPEEIKEYKSKETVTTMKVDSPQTTVVSSMEGENLPDVYSNPGTSRTSVIEKDPKSGTEVEKITEVGVAAWLNESDLNQSKFYALHRTAPIGTIVKLTNRMNNNSVFVKVVGTLPDTGDNKNVIIKITQAAAQRIGAIDQRFTAELSYGISK